MALRLCPASLQVIYASRDFDLKPEREVTDVPRDNVWARAQRQENDVDQSYAVEELWCFFCLVSHTLVVFEEFECI